MGEQQYWVIEDATGAQHLLCDDPTPIETIVEADEGSEPALEIVDRYPDAVHRALLPGFLDLNTQRWDFAASAPVSRWSREEARAKRWEEAKEYNLLMVNFGFVLPDIGWVQTNAESREAIRTLADDAKEALEAGDTGWTINFKNLANDYVPVTAEQVIFVYKSLRIFLGLCVQAKDEAEDRITAAYEGGATVEEILQVDITTGYPV